MAPQQQPGLGRHVAVGGRARGGRCGLGSWRGFVRRRAQPDRNGADGDLLALLTGNGEHVTVVLRLDIDGGLLGLDLHQQITCRNRVTDLDADASDLHHVVIIVHSRGVNGLDHIGCDTSDQAAIASSTAAATLSASGSTAASSERAEGMGTGGAPTRRIVPR